MAADLSKPRPIARNPVPGPHNFGRGKDRQELPCLLDRPGTLFTTSGRAAILLGLQALALKPADRVLVPSYHCPTMVSPILALGHQLGFYPIQSDGRPDLNWLDRHAALDTRVLCVAHFFGLPLDLRETQAWCQRRGVLLLEDCAHAMFGEGAGGAVGTRGDVVIASLPKFFATQDGGLLRVDHPRRPIPPLTPAGPKAELTSWLDGIEVSARHDRLGRWSAWATPLLALKQGLRGRPAFGNAPVMPVEFDPQGEYARIDTVLSHRQPTRATVGTVQRTARGPLVTRRREHYREMAKGFAGHAGLRPLFPELPDGCAPYVFPLWVDQPDPAYQTLRALGVPVSRWDWLWPGVPDLPGDQGKAWSRHVLQLHCHQDISPQDRGWVIEALLSHCTG